MFLFGFSLLESVEVEVLEIPSVCIFFFFSHIHKTKKIFFFYWKMKTILFPLQVRLEWNVKYHEIHDKRMALAKHIIFFFSFCKWSQMDLLYFQVLLTFLEMLLDNYLVPGLLSFWRKDVLLSGAFLWSKLPIAVQTYFENGWSHNLHSQQKMPTSALEVLGFALMYRFNHFILMLGSFEILHHGKKLSFNIYSCLGDIKIFRKRRRGKEINE